MSDYKKEIMEEFEKKFTWKMTSDHDETYTYLSDSVELYEVEAFLSQALDRVAKEAYQEGFLKGHVKGFIDGQKAETGKLSPSEKKEVVRWKNTFVTGMMENFEEASKLSELLFPVEEEKECECYCHYTAQVLITPKAAYLRKDCSHCLPKKEKRGR